MLDLQVMVIRIQQESECRRFFWVIRLGGEIVDAGPWSLRSEAVDYLRFQKMKGNGVAKIVPWYP